MSAPRATHGTPVAPATEPLDERAVEAESRRVAAWFESLSDDAKAGFDRLAELDRGDANGSNGG